MSPPKPMRAAGLVAGLLAGLATLGAAGCGRSSDRGPVGRPVAPSGACIPAARSVVVRRAPASTPPSATPFTTPSGAPGCRFAVARPGGPPLTVQADVDGAPQAYERLDRQAVEYSQNVLWSHAGPAAYPQTVFGLGLAADWFPSERRLLATDGTRLVDVVATWPGASPRTEQALAEAVARSYLNPA